MRPETLRILSTLSLCENGHMERRALMQSSDMRYIASLATGTRPNIFLDGEFYQLTKRGYDSLLSAGAINSASVNRDILPDYIRDANTGSAHRLRRARRENVTAPSAPTNEGSLIVFSIERNAYTTIKIKVHDSLKTWINAHGTKRNFLNTFGDTTARNWDASETTEYVHIELGNIDRNSSGTSNIVTNSGINTLILKLACASENNEYTVKYRGLVTWENLRVFSDALGNEIKAFYFNQIKPCKITVDVRFFI